MTNIKLNKIQIAKILTLLVAIVVYSYTIIMYNSSEWLALSNIALIMAMLMYSKYSIHGVVLMVISNICNNMAVYTERSISNIIGTSVLLISGCILSILCKYTLDNHEDDGINRIISIFKSKSEPVKTKALAKVIIYSLTVSLVLTTCKYMNITFLVSIWVMFPVLSDIAMACRLDDAYILKLIFQLVLLYILYMQSAIGSIDYINIVSVVIVTVSILIGLLEIYISNKNKIE